MEIIRFVDTHSHLYAKEFDDDIDEVIQRTQSKGVDKILLPNIDVQSISRLKQLLKQDTSFVPMLGLHPCSVTENWLKDFTIIKKELENEAICAVGEIGIDLFWDKSTKTIQIDAFEYQCEYAIEQNLPVAIHCRDSIDVVLEILEKEKFNNLKGVMHCFTGNRNQAQKAISLGFYLGLGGVFTFKNSKLKEDLKDIDRNRIVLETDSPYLAPVPFRGKRNESSYIPIIAAHLADMWSMSVVEVAELTTKNAISLFNL